VYEDLTHKEDEGRLQTKSLRDTRMEHRHLYVAVCCTVLQCVAVCCSVLQCVVSCCTVIQCVAVGVY